MKVFAKDPTGKMSVGFLFTRSGIIRFENGSFRKLQKNEKITYL